MVTFSAKPCIVTQRLTRTPIAPFLFWPTQAPFIFGAIAFILIIAGALLRSYWAAMLVGAGLGVTMMLYNGANALMGLKTNSPLLIMIVPIALISVGEAKPDANLDAVELATWTTLANLILNLDEVITKG